TARVGDEHSDDGDDDIGGRGTGDEHEAARRDAVFGEQGGEGIGPRHQFRAGQRGVGVSDGGRGGPAGGGGPQRLNGSRGGGHLVAALPQLGQLAYLSHARVVVAGEGHRVPPGGGLGVDRPNAVAAGAVDDN